MTLRLSYCTECQCFHTAAAGHATPTAEGRVVARGLFEWARVGQHLLRDLDRRRNEGTNP